MNIDPGEIQKLLDKEAICEALLYYTRGIDRHDDALAAQAYHHDATDDHGEYIGGPAGLIQYAKGTHKLFATAHHHYIMNQTIDLDGDAAHVETYFLAAFQTQTGPIQMAGGRYVDRVERRNGRWAITDRVCMVEWNGELTKKQLPQDFISGAWDKSDPSYQRPLKSSRPHRDPARKIAGPE